MELILKEYGTMISDVETGSRILESIQHALDQRDKVVIDFDGIITLTTYNAKQIFGNLYVKLGAKDFYDNIVLKNASQNIKTIIRLGINNSLMVDA